MTHSPRVLDASALIAMFGGHPDLMEMLDDAERGNVFLLLPTVAVAEAEAALNVGLALWTPFLMSRGVTTLDLTMHTAVEAARLADPQLPGAVAGPLMAGQVAFEAQALNAVVVTQMPSMYAGYEVAIMPVEA
ncbi:hypothetical protein ACWT_5839 [Actinoplanes sp. SE50]|uniref:hypothetical protein n=1 Tax=unclassified Actinoplanes TaxID=2626549 RepID=UPI00023EBC2A|nr:MULTISPECIES: hypothetical protein [unclassified Actinoplanes]AEV86857.1 hypothetical protein ACPL_5970 [Actinoplanes sp. SE50/110]ATO85254.1 hypothetical protein ACWT_5839 [Actinoplanes sp. SE50]SLM02664.1 hypothetical protein ACSP50_5946 [Actinoplanes sp. SE50/110]